MPQADGGGGRRRRRRRDEERERGFQAGSEAGITGRPPVEEPVGSRRRVEERTEAPPAFTQPREQPSAPSPRVVAPEFAQIGHRIGVIERVSARSLPAPVVTALADSNLNESALERAARLLSRRFDITPSFIFERRDPSDTNPIPGFIDPVSGREMSLRTATRLVTKNEEEIILGLLRSLQPPPEERGGRQPGQLPRRPAPAGARRIARFLMAISGEIDQGAISFRFAFGAAHSLADSPADIDLFQHNLRMTHGLNALPLQQIAVAHQAAMRGQRIRNLKEAIIASAGDNPNVAAAVQAGEELIETQEARTFTGERWEEEVRRRLEEMPDYRREAIVRSGMTPEMVIQAEVTREMEMAKMSVIGDIGLGAIGKELLQQTEENYVVQANEVAERMRDSGEAFKDSPLGIVLGGIIKAFDYSWRPMGAGLRLTQETIEQGIRAVAPGGDENMARVEFKNSLDDAWDILQGETTFGEAFAEDYGVPLWTGVTLELAAGFMFDPVVLGGRAIRAVNLNRLMSHVVKKKGAVRWLDQADTFINQPQLQFRNKDLVTWMIDRVDEAEDVGRFVRVVQRHNRRTFGTTGFHRTTLNEIFSHGKRLLRRGERAVLDTDLRTLMAGVFMGRMPEGTFASRIDDVFRRKQKVEEDIILRDTGEAIQMTFGDLPPPTATVAAREAEDVQEILSQLTTWEHQMLGQKGARLPRALELPRANLARLGAGAISDRLSEAARAAGIRFPAGISEAGPVARLRYLLNHPTHGNIVWHNPAVDTGESIGRFGIESRVWTQKEIAERQADFTKLLNNTTLPAHEEAMTRWLQKFDRETVERIGKQFGYDEPTARQLYDEVVKGSGRAQAFGLRLADDPKVVARLAEQNRAFKLAEDASFADELSPIYITQHPNNFRMVDPVRLRIALSEAQGGIRRLVTSVYKIQGKVRPTSGIAKHSLYRMTRGTSRNLARGFLKVWKPAVVIRPAYVWRVPVLDEGLIRYNLALGAMTRFRSTKAGAMFTSKVRRMLGMDPWVDEVFTPVTRGPGVPDEIPFRLPGGDPDLAVLHASEVGGIRHLAQLNVEGMAAYIDDVAGAVRKGQGIPWGKMLPSQRGYDRWWADVARNHIARDPAGEHILTLIARGGMDEAAMIDDTFRFLKQAEQKWYVERRLGENWTDDALRHRVGIQVKNARLHTGDALGYSDAGLIAQASLDGTVSARMVKGMADVNGMDLRPPIHGVDSQYAWGIRNQGLHLVNRAADWILALPTNVLNRHPFALEWHDRATRALTKVLDESGIPLNREVRGMIDDEARGFAATQVRQIMFDFTEQGRWAEALGTVFPFAQPWGEVFVTYGRILNRNPAALGYINAVRRSIDQSGFLERDPDTGELMVPMTNFLGIFPLMAATGMIGPDEYSQGEWRLLSPLEGFNLFISSTFPVPWGEGEFPAPIPSLSPLALTFLNGVLTGDSMIPGAEFAHRRLSPEVRTRLATWAFEYGPPKFPQSFVPSWLNNLMIGFMPELAGEDRLKSITLQFLRLQEFTGTPVMATEVNDAGEPVASVPPPPGFSRDQWEDMTPDVRQRHWRIHREEMAESSARAYFTSQGIFAALFPSRVKTDFPFEELRQEFGNMIDRHDGDVGAARTAFIDKHPDLIGITMATTTVGKNAESPVAIPPTPPINILTAHPEARHFGKQFPEFLWAIIPKELRDAETTIDPGVFAREMAEDLRRTAEPDEWLVTEEDRLAWEAYRPLKDWWIAEQDRFEREDVSESDSEYLASKKLFDDGVADIRTIHPDWTYGDIEEEVVDENILRQIPAMLENKTFREFEAGKWLNRYWDATRGRGATAGNAKPGSLQARMLEAGVHSIDTKGAEELGFTQEHEALVKQLNEEFPDGEKIFNIFLYHDLKGMPNALERARDRLGVGSPAEQQLMSELAEYDQYDYGEISRLEGVDQDIAWAERRDWIDQYMIAHPKQGRNGLMLDWLSKNPNDRQDYLRSLMSRPYQYWTRFDREFVLNERTNDTAESFWTAYALARVEIARRSEAGEETGPLYASIDKQIQGLLTDKSIPEDDRLVLARQVYNANDWGYAFEATNPFYRRRFNARAHQHWQAWVEGVRTIQSIATKNEMNFLENDDYWRKLEGALVDYRDALWEDNPAFKRQWKQLEELNGTDDLIFDFIPDKDGVFPYYFPIGDWPVANQSFAAADPEKTKLPIAFPIAKPSRSSPAIDPEDDGQDARGDGASLYRQPINSPEDAQRWARVFVRQEYGWDDDEWEALKELWSRESGWRYDAANPESSARGIPQAMMSIHFGQDWLYDSNRGAQRFLRRPKMQIKWGASYIHGNYGRPSVALAGHSGANMGGPPGY